MRIIEIVRNFFGSIFSLIRRRPSTQVHHPYDGGYMFSAEEEEAWAEYEAERDYYQEQDSAEALAEMEAELATYYEEQDRAAAEDEERRLAALRAKEDEARWEDEDEDPWIDDHEELMASGAFHPSAACDCGDCQSRFGRDIAVDHAARMGEGWENL